ncbi:LysM peptidoglycan-binding domain-containing protein [Chloroflexota bacterium]
MNVRRFFFLLLTLVLLCPAGPTTAQNAPALEALRLINDLRASRGLTPFTLNASLTAAAQSHADWMAATTSYTHTGAGGSSAQQRATAAGYPGYISENIVGGTNLSPQQGVVWWENSAIHYRTMTSTRHIHAGIGFASNGGQNMFVLVVGVPSDYALPASNGQRAGNSGPNAAAPDPAPQAAAPVIVMPVEKAAPREDGAIIHEIQLGQTAWDIAAVYGVDLETLLALNYLPDDPVLLPGDEITVQRGTGTGGAAEPLTHIVREGQTAWAIAARYHIALADLLWLNNLGENAVILPGDELIVRLAEGQTPPPTPTPPTAHLIQAGETAWEIALRYGLTLEDLLALNDLTAEALLLPGEELRIRLPDMTPTPTPPPMLPSATPQPIITPLATAAATTVSVPLPAVTPTNQLLPPTATLIPPVADAAAGPSVRTMIGVLVIGTGILALAGLAGIEIFERLFRR